MKKELSILFACLILLWVDQGRAQILSGFPRPKVYYSFNASSFDNSVAGYKDLYQPGKYANKNGNTSPLNTGDRFSRTAGTLFLSSSISHEQSAWDVVTGKGFGLVGTNDQLPDNFTISCWVNIPPFTDSVERGILYSKPNFALTYKGHEIFLRRFASGVIGNGLYEYKFWSPASFDVPGWHQVFLVFGTRLVDRLRYVKIYVGKPAYISYDGAGPRSVPANSDPVAWNFGGAYAFLNAVDGYNQSSGEWGFGNPYTTNLVDGQPLATAISVDDVAVWDIAMSENDAKKLFTCQSQFSGRDDRCWASSPVPETAGVGGKSAAGNRLMADSASARSGNYLDAYASSRSTLQVNLTLAQPQGVNIYLYDMNGRLLAEKADIAGFNGVNALQLPVGNLTPGIYIIKAMGIDLNLIQKVQIH